MSQREARNKFGEGADLTAMLIKTISVWMEGRAETNQDFNNAEIIAALEITKFSVWEFNRDDISDEDRDRIGREYREAFWGEP